MTYTPGRMSYRSHGHERHEHKNRQQKSLSSRSVGESEKETIMNAIEIIGLTFILFILSLVSICSIYIFYRVTKFIFDATQHSLYGPYRYWPSHSVHPEMLPPSVQ